MGLSVLMSVYGKEKAEYLRESLQSLYNQTRIPEEVVVVKDGPLTDELEAVLSEFAKNQKQLKVVAIPESVQLGRALQKGLEHCSQELVARMDSDDISLPNRFETQCRYMEEHPEVDVFGGWIEEFDDTGNKCGIRQTPEKPEEIRKYLKFRNPMNHVTVIFRKKSVLESGGYQHVPGFEDYDLWTRMLLKKKVLRNQPQLFVAVRTNPDMYERRGGMAYFKRNAAFRKVQRERGIINIPEYFLSLGIVLLVALQPSGLRKIVYRKFLRKSSRQEAERKHEEIIERGGSCV